MNLNKSTILKNIVLPISDVLMNTNIIRTYKVIKLIQYYSKEEIIQWQYNKLILLLNHAYNNTNYYSQLFKKIGLKPNDIKSIQDLNKIPVLTKDIIRSNYTDLLPSNLEILNYKKAATGGSTGDPLVFLLDKKSWSYTTANQIYNWEKVGYNYGDKFIALGSTSLYVNKNNSFKHFLYYKLKSKIGLNGINMSDDVCSNYIKIILKENISFVYGYASAIFLLAKYVLHNNITIQLKACFTTSEILTSKFRETISSAFNCIVMDCYGARDGGISAFELSEGFYEVGYNCLVNIERSENNDLGDA